MSNRQLPYNPIRCAGQRFDPVLPPQNTISDGVCTSKSPEFPARKSRRVAICWAMKEFRKEILTHCIHEQQGLLIAFFQT